MRAKRHWAGLATEISLISHFQMVPIPCTAAAASLHEGREKEMPAGAGRERGRGLRGRLRALRHDAKEILHLQGAVLRQVRAVEAVLHLVPRRASRGGVNVPPRRARRVPDANTAPPPPSRGCTVATLRADGEGRVGQRAECHCSVGGGWCCGRGRAGGDCPGRRRTAPAGSGAAAPGRSPGLGQRPSGEAGRPHQPEAGESGCGRTKRGGICESLFVCVIAQKNPEKLKYEVDRLSPFDSGMESVKKKTIQNATMLVGIITTLEVAPSQRSATYTNSPVPEGLWWEVDP